MKHVSDKLLLQSLLICELMVIIFNSKQQQQKQAKLTREMDGPCGFLQNSKLSDEVMWQEVETWYIHPCQKYPYIQIYMVDCAQKKNYFRYHFMVPYIWLGRINHLGTNYVWTSSISVDMIEAMYRSKWLVNFGRDCNEAYKLTNSDWVSAAVQRYLSALMITFEDCLGSWHSSKQQYSNDWLHDGY